MNNKSSSSNAHDVRFLLDPACPWAWRTSLWIRAAARVRPLTIEWGILSLEYVNRDKKDNAYMERIKRSRRSLRLLAKAREVAGDEGIGRLYLAIGDARHNQGHELDDEDMLAKALNDADLSSSLMEETREDKALDAALESTYEKTFAGGAFGVPTLYIDHSDVPYFGPVIDEVPPDEKAGELWDLIVGITDHPYFYEIKRPRN